MARGHPLLQVSELDAMSARTHWVNKMSASRVLVLLQMIFAIVNVVTTQDVKKLRLVPVDTKVVSQVGILRGPMLAEAFGR
jgi:hypothetical protein